MRQLLKKRLALFYFSLGAVTNPEFLRFPEHAKQSVTKPLLRQVTLIVYLNALFRPVNATVFEARFA